jgi:hypothetical protein
MGTQSILPEPLAVTIKVTTALESLGVAYAIGGSLASTVYGDVRTTQDSDILADMRPEHIDPFVQALQAEFFMDPQMIADAIARNSSFNIIHRESMFKVDVFIPEQTPFNRSELNRARRHAVSADAAIAADFCSAEDTVLSKLHWFRMGGETSERQWRDAQGILKTQGGALDQEYLRNWAHELGITDLLERLLEET